MAQLSRPYQIALVALALLAAVWLLALRGHSSGGGGKSASTPAPQPAPSNSPGAPYTPYKGSAPGVAGLTRAIQKAKGAVAQSERNAKQLDEKSAQASNPNAGQQSSGSASSSSTSAAGSASKGAGAKRHAASRHVTRHKVVTHATATSGLPPNQAMVERELKRGFSAAILFWSPKAADDVVVHGELQRLLAAQRHDPAARKAGRELGDASVVVATSGSKAKVAVHMSLAGKVASYGSFTRAIQVYQTPTLLIVNPKGRAVAITGITDAFAIEQALDEPLA